MKLLRGEYKLVDNKLEDRGWFRFEVNGLSVVAVDFVIVYSPKKYYLEVVPFESESRN